MNAKGDANRSVRMTKQRLYQALITLLQQKSLREITVRELTELAGISRGTFYFHYTDTYDLRNQIEDELVEELKEAIAEFQPEQAEFSLRPLHSALRQKLGVGVYPQRQKADCRALPGRVRAGRRHRGAEIYAGLCSERLLWYHRCLAGGRV